MEGTEMNRLIIIGASGHGKVIADIAMRNWYENIVYRCWSSSRTSTSI